MLTPSMQTLFQNDCLHKPQNLRMKKYFSTSDLDEKCKDKDRITNPENRKESESRKNIQSKCILERMERGEKPCAKHNQG